MINEQRKLITKMNEEIYKAANFAHSFRVHLFPENLGIDPKNEILNDPLTFLCYNRNKKFYNFL